jgi:sensory rhodopsin
MTQFWLWIGVISMTVAAIFFGIGAAKGKNESWRILFTLNFFITAIAAGLYLAMAFSQGYANFGERQVYWIRYFTWFLTTPLLLLVLTYLGRTRLSTILGLIGANGYMLVTGFIATVSPIPLNFVWYLVSCGAFAGILYLLLKPYRNQAVSKSPGAVGRKVFKKLLTVHVSLWSLYPLVWILGDTGFGLISDDFEAMFYTVLDIAAKVGFGFLSLNSLTKLESNGMSFYHPPSEEHIQRA